MAANTILFIEGQPKTTNGDLKKGFVKLLQQNFTVKLPRIILGGGKLQTINKFKTNQLEAKSFLLLVDLDNTESERENDLKTNSIIQVEDSIFYMIQEMESWFLSQPEILDNFFGDGLSGKKISSKIPKKKTSEILNPAELLLSITKNSKRGTYHKIKHAVELLKLLDACQLEKDFPDFKRLIEKLKV